MTYPTWWMTLRCAELIVKEARPKRLHTVRFHFSAILENTFVDARARGGAGSMTGSIDDILG